MAGKKRKSAGKGKEDSNFEKAVLSVLIAVLIISAGFTFYTLFMPAKNDKATNKNPGGSQPGQAAQQTGLNEIVTGSTDAGGVAIQLRPIGVENGKLRVDFAANTHDVTLSNFYLSDITTLEYNGITLLPESVPVMSGHHVYGQLIFNLDAMPGSFTIKIKGIPLVDERVYQWSTK
ncbi:hypothetical protein J4227_03415 [Candidatus Woesearchaeota archaeon]|nr:hypothetical protein [Candidatus Woesearchaeota archaeon]